MNDKRYFFFDVDGTLTDRATDRIVPSAKEALKRLEAEGRTVVIATGRAMYKARPFFEENGFHDMVCSGGNGIIVDDKEVENSPLDYATAKALYDQAIEAGYGVLTAVDDSQKVYARDFTFYDQVGIRKEPTTYIIDEHFDPEDFGTIYKMYISVPIGEEDRLPLLETTGWLRFEKEYALIQPDDKKGGILRLLELIDGTPEQTVVFGDDTNDLVMFDPAFFCVAMGNACDELKEKADFVAAANVDDGIMKTCEKFGWI